MRTRPATLVTVLALAGAVALTGCGRSTKRENAMLKDENARLNSDFQQVSSEKESAETNLNSANAKLQQAAARIKDLAGQLDQTKKALSAAQAKYAETSKRFQAKVDSDAKTIADSQTQFNALRESFEKCQSDNAAAAAANEKANAQIAELAKQVATLSSKPAATSSAAPARQNLGGKTSAGVNDR
jgi:chromosome segregation ATPase